MVSRLPEGLLKIRKAPVQEAPGISSRRPATGSR